MSTVLFYQRGICISLYNSLCSFLFQVIYYVHRALVGVGSLEEADVQLLEEDPPDHGVDGLRRDEAAPHRLGERGRGETGPPAARCRPAREGERGGLGAVAREVVVLVEQADADVVGDDQAVEAPLAPQDLGQQAAKAWHDSLSTSW